MAIVPAHNEENVIKNLVDSLNAQNYPKELYDVYVIADNCTDRTAEIAKEAGAKVYKRFDEAHKTKGFALNWFLKQKIEEDADYDAFCVFDADNIVDKDFLKNMNKKLCQGEEIVQGYRDIKNPTDSWITGGYAIFYWMMNRFYHLARYNLGLSPLINGTGFMVKFDIIKPNGWQTVTLTEDIEFSLINIAKGRRLGWATDAKVYDEQPVHFDQSWSQRSRWTVGHLQCMQNYTKDLVMGVVKNKTLMNFDGALYLFGIPMMILTFLLLGVNTLLYMGAEMTFADLIGNYARYLIATFILPIVTGVAIMALDKREIKPMMKAILCYPLFIGSWILINIKCLIKPNTKWEKIEHVRDINIQEVKAKEVIN
jgi:cellulose synthase/poly-beta-1,6-N-acetylglucosamine synthase-like glycosyltransferase